LFDIFVLIKLVPSQKFQAIFPIDVSGIPTSFIDAVMSEFMVFNRGVNTGVNV
jgi:hypothetical protein